MSIDEVIDSLKHLRVKKRMDELEIHQLIEDQLKADKISFRREKIIKRGSRLDFYVEGGIVIEVKKRRPNKKSIIRQLEKYTASEKVKAVILVIERFMDLPESINGKPVRVVSLRKLWGIAI